MLFPHPAHLRLAAVLSFLAAPSAAQFDYSLGMDVREKTWDVECRFANPKGEAFEFWLARWTPGAYHLADYGRFVTELKARSADGKRLDVERIDDTHFRIDAAGVNSIVLRYSADSISTSQFSHNVIDVEANRITKKYAYVNSTSLFGFVPGRLNEPYSLHLDLPKGWHAASVLEEGEDLLYRAPSFYRFEDSPFLFSPDLITEETEAGGKKLTISVVGKDGEELESLVDDCVAIVESAGDLLGGLPYDHYEFLFAFVPEAGGSGLEHSYSTLILMPNRAHSQDAWGIIAHEFFHLWCAERIHVEAIHDPDYTQPFETSTIWVNESITEYFSRLILVNAGLSDELELLNSVAADKPQLEAMAKAGRLLPGTEASRRARSWDSMQDLMPFVLAMYIQGPSIIFALDMEMRSVSEDGHGVADLVDHLMAEYVEKDRGFPEDGMLKIINRVSGGDLSSFYAAHIDGIETLDMERYLEVIGYRLERGTVVELDEPTEQQLAVRADFFSIDG